MSGASAAGRTVAGEHAPDPAIVTAFAHLLSDARAVLGRWDPPDAAQAGLRAAYLAHLDRHPDAVAKAGPPAHLTASCLVVDDRGEQVLLTHHRRAGRWFQFGGHLESSDTSVRAGARREAEEESGLVGLSPSAVPVQLDRHLLGSEFGRCHEHLDVRYAVVVSAGSRPRVGPESHDVRWWPVGSLPGGTRHELEPLVSRALVDLGLR